MLEVIELRKGVLEFHDSSFARDRESLFNRIRSALVTIIVVLVLFVVSLVLHFQWYYSWILIPLIIGVSLYFVKISLPILTNYQIQGFTIYLDPDNSVKRVVANYWEKFSNSNFREEIIRFNQAIGFKGLMDNDGKMSIEIIVDRNYPGDIIFSSYDMGVLAETHRSLLVLFPSYTELFIEMEDGTDWEDEDKTMWEELSKNTRIPRVLTNYLTKL